MARLGYSAVEYLFVEHPVETVPEPEIEIDALSAALRTLGDTVSDTVAKVLDNPWQLVLPIPVDESPAQTVNTSEVVSVHASPVISVHASPVISDTEEEEEMEEES